MTGQSDGLSANGDATGLTIHAKFEGLRMAWSCAELFTQEMAAACFQAEAALRAGEAQAQAARIAGWLTLAAGGLALLAAIIGTYFSHNGNKRQIASAEHLQASEQKYIAKRDVYLNVSSGLYAGLMAISRISDARIPVDEALKLYYLEGPKISQIHMVAPIQVLNDVMPALAAISQVHLSLMSERLSLGIGGTLPATWSIVCIRKINPLIFILNKAILSMRSDLGLPIDYQAYEALITKFTQQTTAQAEETLRSIEANLRF